MIESRYTIEYVNPESEQQKKPAKGHFLSFIFLGLIITAALVYAFLSINKPNQFVRLPEIFEELSPSNDSVEISSETKMTDKESIYILAGATTAPSTAVESSTATAPSLKPDQKNQQLLASVQASNEARNDSAQKEIEKLLLENKEQQNKTKKQLANNKELTNNLNDLTKQLMAERKRSKTLGAKLDSKKTENTQLSTMLKNALEKASTEDKNYLVALNKLEEKESINLDKKNKEITPETKVIATTTQTPKTIDRYNKVSLSTTSQVDAIIAAMNGNAVVAQKSTNKLIAYKPVNNKPSIQLAAITVTETDSLHVQLQREINQLLSGITSLRSNENYGNSLEKESQTRENAMRSITIKKGETIWGIAERAYGNGSYYKKIMEANPQVNTGLLQEGQVLNVPK